MSVSAIIVAAGSSMRMGFDKLSADLLGKPVLYHSVHAFCQCPDINQVIVVAPPERFALIANDFVGRNVIRVDGGLNRQSSVQAGIYALPDDTIVVAIHDGARPLIRPEDITKCLEAAKKYGSASLARPVTETLKSSDHEGFTRGGVDRKDLFFMETPQCFRANILRRAYNNIAERRMTVTDDVSAAESIGISSKIIHATTPNLKITFPGDVKVAANLMNS